MKALLPDRSTRRSPSAINLEVMLDRTPTIRASLRDTETTLLISVALVILVVFLFLGNVRAALIPSGRGPRVADRHVRRDVPRSAISLNIFTLMALTIATGFVVDDAIVVLENATRHIEEGMKPFDAALREARSEVGFTVRLDELLADRGLHPDPVDGRPHRAASSASSQITLSVAILVSLVVSLTTTPMMCAYRAAGEGPAGQRTSRRRGERCGVRSASRASTAASIEPHRAPQRCR